MIWLFDFSVAVVVAFLFGWLLYTLAPMGSGDANEGFNSTWLIFLFILLLLPTWGGGIWMVPMGPAFFGVQIFNFLLMGLLVALVVGTLLAATKMPPATQTQNGERLPREALLAQQELRSWNQFFWVLLVVMLVSIFFGYWGL